jgi:glycosyltransferase involved in cell wall biosynthesis
MARVIIFLNRLIIGGAALDTVQLAGDLSDEHEVFLVVGEKVSDEYDAFFMAKDLKNVTVIPLHDMHRSVNLLKDTRAFLKIWRLIRRLKPDVVHTNGAKPGFLGRLAARLCGVKVIFHTYHGHIFHSYFNSFITAIVLFLERRMAAFSTKLIALSESQKKELTEHYRIAPANKFEIVKLGIDLHKFNGDLPQKRTKFRKDYLLNDDEIAIGIVGRIVPVKNHSLFIDIAKDILQQTHKKVRFFIVGDGMQRQALEERLLSEKILFTHFPAKPVEAPITFTSWILNVDEVMAGLDIVVLTSLNEGTPISLMEAQAAGRPVVSTKVGAVDEVVINEQTGFIIPLNDRPAFVRVLQWLINDESLRQQMGAKGMEFIHSNFPRQQQVDAMKALYRQTLANR